MFGFVNINKPSGITSHDVVSYLRRVLKIKKIGHTGTLDPLAEGVLPIAIGDATRLIEYLDDEKEYLAFIKFGESTTTYDKEGEITFKSDLIPSLSELNNELEKFRGEIFQKPPIYSALKKNGKKLYEYAREGKEVEIEARKVFIEKLELISFEENVATVKIKCSKGTYIRSIANDLGENLKTGAHLIKLIRTQAGSFMINNSTDLYELKEASDIEKILISPQKALSNMPELEIDENEHQKVDYGQNFESDKFTNFNNRLIILCYCNKIKAVARICNKKTILQKVFH